MKITKSLLESIGAFDLCQQIIKFEELYPNGVKLTIKNALIALDDGMNVLWLTRLLPPREQVCLALKWARRVQRFTKDKRVRDCLDIVQRWLDGEDVDLNVAAKAAAYHLRGLDNRASKSALAAVAAAATAKAAWKSTIPAAELAMETGADTVANVVVRVVELARGVEAAANERREQVKMLVKSLLKVEGNF